MTKYTTEEQAQFDERWRVACEEAKVIQGCLAKGYLVMRGHERIDSMTIEEDGILSRDGNYCLVWFSKDRECDDGMHTPVDKVRAIFRKLEVFVPVKLVEQVKAALPHVNGRTPDANWQAIKKIQALLERNGLAK